jgi:predicted phosphodiesterase
VAMRNDIERRRRAGLAIDFVLVSGDLAFSGNAAEYDLAREFLEALATVAGVPRESIFCVPGNHDVDRDRQTMTFAGARHKLNSQTDIYSFLQRIEERETLLKRIENFRFFLESCSPAQPRTWTGDGLGYVSAIDLDDIRIGIIGLNSAWLAEGDIGDHGRLLLGEGQVRDALRLVGQHGPHIVLAVSHHPLNLLRDFDRAPAQRLIEEGCQFFHCGHLHEPDARDAVHGNSRCLTVSAGASFESRESHNTYSMVTLDALRATSTVIVVQFNPHTGAFSAESKSEHLLGIDAVDLCTVDELGAAIESFVPSSCCPYYLAALLLKVKAEVPIESASGFLFGTVDVLEDQPDGELKSATLGFITFGNALKIFSGRMNLRDILSRHGEVVRQYALVLEKRCIADDRLREQASEREREARAFAKVEPSKPFEHTFALLDELRAGGDWEGLRRQAERLVDSKMPAVALKARRMLALALGNSTERADIEGAAAILQNIQFDGSADAGDLAALALILVAIGDYSAAKVSVISALAAFPENRDGFVEVGMRIVEATGDRELRDLLSISRSRRS